MILATPQSVPSWFHSWRRNYVLRGKEPISSHSAPMLLGSRIHMKSHQVLVSTGQRWKPKRTNTPDLSTSCNPRVRGSKQQRKLIQTPVHSNSKSGSIRRPCHRMRTRQDFIRQSPGSCSKRYFMERIWRWHQGLDTTQTSYRRNEATKVKDSVKIGNSVK